MLHSHFVYVLNVRTVFDYLQRCYTITLNAKEIPVIIWNMEVDMKPFTFSFPSIVNHIVKALTLTSNLTRHLRVCICLT